MKTYLEHLSKEEGSKQEFEAAINNAAKAIAKKQGFNLDNFQEKDYSNTASLNAYTVKLLWTGACCGQ